MIFEKKNLCANDVVVERKIKFVINAQVVLAFTIKFFGVFLASRGKRSMNELSLERCEIFFMLSLAWQTQTKKGKRNDAVVRLKVIKTLMKRTL